MPEEFSPHSRWRFIGETILDSSVLPVGTHIRKRWTLRNLGPGTWDGSYRVRFMNGDRMGGPEEAPLPRMVGPNEEVDIVVPMQVPDAAGHYRGDWHLVDGDGRIVRSGGSEHIFWIEIDATFVNMSESDGFNWPVGDLTNKDKKWGGWRDAQPFMTDGRDEAQKIAEDNKPFWHPGGDLNFGPMSDSDLGLPVHAIGHGVVKAAKEHDSWGNIVMIEHTLPDGSMVWSQYAHLKTIEPGIEPGVTVLRGTPIGTVGKGQPTPDKPEGRFMAHLHFEIRQKSFSEAAWRNIVFDLAKVTENYLDPLKCIQDNFAPLRRTVRGGNVIIEGEARRVTLARALMPAALPQWTLGMNMREFAYFDLRGIGSALNLRDFQIKHLQFLRDMGVRAVRFYGSHKDCETTQCIDRIGEALKLLADHGMKAVIVLNDSLGHSALYVKGDDPFHTEPGEAYLEKKYFTQQGYRQNYIGHIKKVAAAFGRSSTILFWELGNEYVIKPTDPPPTKEDRDHFTKFAKEASEAIAANASQRISTGLLNSHQISQSGEDVVRTYAKELYQLKFVEVASIHYYREDNEKSWGKVDVDVVNKFRIPKPYYVGELGGEIEKGNRAPFFEAELTEWKNAGIPMVMPWGFSLERQPYLDNRSIIKGEHPDFDDVVDVLKRFA